MTRWFFLLALVAGCHGSATRKSGEPRWHRPTAAACTMPSPEGDCQGTPDMLSGSYTCNSDDDCPGAHCFQIRFDEVCSCSVKDCSSDADCSTNQACGCAASLDPRFRTNHCIDASCHTDADCGAGQYCAAAVDEQCGYFFGVMSYRCTTPNDTCRTDADCGGDGHYAESSDPYCTYSPELGHWACVDGQCAG